MTIPQLDPSTLATSPPFKLASNVFEFFRTSSNCFEMLRMGQNGTFLVIFLLMPYIFLHQIFGLFQSPMILERCCTSSARQRANACNAYAHAAGPASVHSGGDSHSTIRLAGRYDMYSRRNSRAVFAAKEEANRKLNASTRHL